MTESIGIGVSNKLVLVTGAASGIGRACAELCATEGAKVVYIDKEELGKLTTTGDHMPYRCDVTVGSQIDQLSDKVFSHYGQHPNAVIHSAGIVGTVKGLEGTTEEMFDKIMTTNMKGTFLINRKFALLMRDHNIKGSIVNVSSTGVNGCSRFPAYCASKGAQVSWTKSLAKEFAPIGIRFNTVNPGITDTPILMHSGVSPEEFSKDPVLRPPMPMGRLATPIEVAQMCVFLISDRASYITGSCHTVDGTLG